MKKGLLVFALVAVMMLSVTAMASALIQTQATNRPATPARLTTGVNANQTGVDNPINKSVSNQSVHQNFQSNTNACASCHMTHTGQARYLLFANTELKVCSSCHDGTLGSYNVFKDASVMRNSMDALTTQADKSAFAGGGTFAGALASNSSAHMVSNGLTNEAAPGAVKKAGDTTTTWTANFECSSCHAPHGSYSSVLLTNNPNNVAYGVDASGNKIGKEKPVKLAHFNSLTLWNNKTVTDVWAPSTTNDASGNPIANLGPWLTSGKDRTSGTYATRIVGATGDALDDHLADGSKYNDSQNLYVNYGLGYIKTVIPDGSTTPVVDPTGLQIIIAKPLVVKFDGKTGAYTDYGTGSSEFCATCHTDYNSAKGSAASADTGNYRHTIAKGIKPGMQGDVNSKMVCLSCHYAHGTAAEIQRDSADAYLSTGTVDQNKSSALKKYVNMAVCWKCHQDSHNEVFLSSESYWNAR